MEKIKFLTDSACDITVEDEKKYDIKVMPFPVTIDDKGYYERVDFTNDTFYELAVNSKSIPKTAHLTNLQFCETYAEIFQQGYTDIIHVTINSKGSATYQAALMGKELFFEEYPVAKGKINIHIIDSLTYTVAYGIPLVEAAKKMVRGASVNSILAYLNDWFSSVEVYFSPYNLDFAKKSGRISCAAAFVGELIGLRPIIRVMDGEMTIIEKVRGDKNILPALAKYAIKNMVPQTPYTCARGSLDGVAEELHTDMKKKLGYEGVGIFKIGAAITCNSGPKVVGIIIKGKKRR